MATSNTTPEPQTDALVSETTKPTISKETKIAGITTAALLLGGTAWAITSGNQGNGTSPLPDPGSTTPIDSAATAPTNTTATIALKPDTDILVAGGKLHIVDAPIAHKVNDSMSFGDAFEAARHEVGGGGVFAWHHDIYNTFTKDEWSGLSLTQRQEFLKSTGYEAVAKHEPAHQIHPHHSPKTPPTMVEGEIGGHRVMGIDSDNDGVIDTLVAQGADGFTYKVVDTGGNQGLDTAYKFDPVKQEIVMTEKLSQPFIMTNEELEQGIENSMMNEIMASALADVQAAADATDADTERDMTDPDPDDSNHDSDEGYVNNAEMGEYND